MIVSIRCSALLSNVHAKIVVRSFCFLLLFLFMSCSEPTAEEVEAEIARYPLLGVANQLCLNTPVPEGFMLVAKQSGSNSNGSLITFYYHGELKADKVLDFYRDYFARIGWERTSFDKGRFGASFITMRFEKDKYSVAIENMNPGYANFAVSCGVLAKH